MSEFHTKELEKSIKDFKKTIENSYAEISFLEKKKNINFDFYDLNNKEIDYKIETQKDIIDCFSKKIRKNNELLLKLNFKKVPPFLKTDINSNDNKIEKSKLINAKTGKKIKL